MAERVLRDRRMPSSERLAQFNKIERQLEAERAGLDKLKSMMETKASEKLSEARSSSSRRTPSERALAVSKVINSERL